MVRGMRANRERQAVAIENRHNLQAGCSRSYSLRLKRWWADTKRPYPNIELHIDFRHNYPKFNSTV